MVIALGLEAPHLLIQDRGRNRAESEIAALSAALESYKADHGSYPTNRNVGLGPESLYGSLAPPNGKIYFEFSRSMITPAGIVDPYGRLYQYVFPGSPSKSGPQFFDLWSYGRAGKSNDVPANWPNWVKNW